MVNTSQLANANQGSLTTPSLSYLLRIGAEGQVDANNASQTVVHPSLDWFPPRDLGPLEESLRAQGQLAPGLAVRMPNDKLVLIHGHRELAACRRIGLPFDVRVIDGDALKGYPLETLVVELGTANFATVVLTDTERAIVAGRLYLEVYQAEAQNRKLTGKKLAPDVECSGYAAAARAAKVSVNAVRDAVCVLGSPTVLAAVVAKRISLSAGSRCVRSERLKVVGKSKADCVTRATLPSVEAIDQVINTPMAIQSDDDFEFIATATVEATKTIQSLPSGLTKPIGADGSSGKRAASTRAVTRGRGSGTNSTVSGAIDGRRPRLPRELDSTLRELADEFSLAIYCATPAELAQRFCDWAGGQEDDAMVVVEATFALPWGDLKDTPFAIIGLSVSTEARNVATKHLLVFVLADVEPESPFVRHLGTLGVVYTPAAWNY